MLQHTFWGWIIAAAVGFSLHAAEQRQANSREDGYRGIWFTLGQFTEHGDKYSGGLGTYTANHKPIAIYSSEANKTFFTYGGTIKGKRHLLIMVSAYDHATGRVPRPTVVHDKEGVDDPHDNAALTIGADKHIWVFVSGRARGRPGFIYRSKAPLSVDSFERIEEKERTYPQPHVMPEGSFFYLFTKYTKGRELYWSSSADGKSWTPDQKLAGMGGHYQVSERRGETIASAFMWHPGGNVDKRTNLYYVQTADRGRTWTTADGRPLRLPLADPKCDALLIDYQAQGLNVYIHDLCFDQEGRPAILYLVGKGHEPGPQNGPRRWLVTRFDGAKWQTHSICESDHNYDTGALWIDAQHWRVIGPTEPGPQPFGTGGEMALWESRDGGQTWSKTRDITRNSRFNHSYARRVENGKHPFACFWADGNPREMSESRLYFSDAEGKLVYQLPYDLKGDEAEPIRIQSVP